MTRTANLQICHAKSTGSCRKCIWLFPTWRDLPSIFPHAHTTKPVSVNMTNVWAQLCYPIHPQTKSKSSWSLSSLWLRCDSSKRSIQSDRIYRPEIPKIYGGSPTFWTFYVLEHHHNMWMHWCICLKVCMGVGGCVQYILVHLNWYVHQYNYQLNNSSTINNQLIFTSSGSAQGRLAYLPTMAPWLGQQFDPRDPTNRPKWKVEIAMVTVKTSSLFHSKHTGGSWPVAPLGFMWYLFLTAILEDTPRSFDGSNL